MTPVYFPFTYITKPSLELMLTCFKHISVYQPSSEALSKDMQEWVKKDLIKIFAQIQDSDPGDEDKINSFFKAYNNWKNSKELHAASFLKAWNNNNLPFFEDNSISRIREDILKKPVKNRFHCQEKDVLLNARIFLKLAQELDSQTFDINQSLRELKKKEENLFSNLKDKEELPINNMIVMSNEADNPGQVMISKRIKAWTYMNLKNLYKNPFFLTNNRNSFTYMMDNIPDTKTTFCIDQIPHYNIDDDINQNLWKDKLISYINQLSKQNFTDNLQGYMPEDLTIFNKNKGSDNLKVALTISVILNKTPIECFKNILNCINCDCEFVKQTSEYINTVFGLVEIIA